MRMGANRLFLFMPIRVWWTLLHMQELKNRFQFSILLWLRVSSEGLQTAFCKKMDAKRTVCSRSFLMIWGRDSIFAIEARALNSQRRGRDEILNSVLDERLMIGSPTYTFNLILAKVQGWRTSWDSKAHWKQTHYGIHERTHTYQR